MAEDDRAPYMDFEDEWTEEISMNRTARKAASAAGMLLVGDAIAHFIYPRGHVDVWSWKKGPAVYQKALASIRGSFGRLLLVSAGELAVGIGLLALSQRPR